MKNLRRKSNPSNKISKNIKNGNRDAIDPRTKQEQYDGGFFCDNCKKFIPINVDMATRNRNHCPFCLWSFHLDKEISGDRESQCLSGMEPISLTFKKIKKDKYKDEQLGELMIVHICTHCEKISINRIAADDDAKKIQELFEASILLPDKTKSMLLLSEITPLIETDRLNIDTQLFGNSSRK